MRRIALLAAVAIACCGSVARAETIYGLTSLNGLVSFDSANPLVTSVPVTISQAGIVDLDFNNVNGLLYGATANGNLYTINKTTGAATQVVAAGTGLLGNVTDFDFNPAADRVRIFTAGGASKNYRMVPDAAAVSLPQLPGTAGAITVDGNFSDTNAVLVGSAYTNAFDNPASTVLYSINTTTDALMIHSTVGADPVGSFNTVTQVGTGLGIVGGLGSNVGFDIGVSGIAYLSNDSVLYTVNLATGVATLAGIGVIGTAGITSIAVEAVPEPSTIAGIALVGAGCLWQARRRRIQAASSL